MKVYVRCVLHLRKLKKSMLVNREKLFARNDLCWRFFPAGLCQVYVSTSLLGPTKREALILAEKFNLDEFQNPYRPWFGSFRHVGGCHEDGMKQTCSHARFRKTCGNNKHRPGNFAAEKLPAPVRFSSNEFSETYNLDLVIIVQSFRISQALANPNIIKSILAGATCLQHPC